MLGCVAFSPPVLVLVNLQGQVQWKAFCGALELLVSRHSYAAHSQGCTVARLQCSSFLIKVKKQNCTSDNVLTTKKLGVFTSEIFSPGLKD